MLHFIGILAPREDFPDGDDRQKPFFGSELRVTGSRPHPEAVDKAPDPADKRTDPAETMPFVNLLSPPFI